MPVAAWGVGRALEGVESGRIAAQNAVDRMGTARPVMAVAFISQEFSVEDVLQGITPLLPNVPIWGFSTAKPITKEGSQQRSVVLGVISGQKLSADLAFFPNYDQDSIEKHRLLNQKMKQAQGSINGVLLTADANTPHSADLLEMLAAYDVPVCGCLAAGAYMKGKTSQLGGNRHATGALSAALLGGRFRMASAKGHGWMPTGKSYRVTKFQNSCVQELDGKSPVKIFAGLFGYPEQDWLFQPLSELVRLYPLGISMGDGKPLRICSPLRVEMDGSFQMNIPLEEGAIVNLMIGDVLACQKAASLAAESALQQLGSAQPMLAVLLVDTAWSLLFRKPGNFYLNKIKEVLGDVPLLGAYTYGQIASGEDLHSPQLFNQDLQIILLGMQES